MRRGQMEQVRVGRDDCVTSRIKVQELRGDAGIQTETDAREMLCNENVEAELPLSGRERFTRSMVGDYGWFMSAEAP